MYAIIVDGGRQYRVEPGMEVDVDYRDVPQGESLTFEKVLAVSGDEGLKLGSPTLDGASVTASIIGPKMDKKIYVQKFRRRKNSRRRTGHRQIRTERSRRNHHIADVRFPDAKPSPDLIGARPGPLDRHQRGQWRDVQ